MALGQIEVNRAFLDAGLLRAIKATTLIPDNLISREPFARIKCFIKTLGLEKITQCFVRSAIPAFQFRHVAAIVRSFFCITAETLLP